MKKTLAIFLILQFVSNNHFAGEMIKVFSLFSHYHHHTHSHHDTHDFHDFLSKHYSDDMNDKDGDHDDDHKNLPFKHSDSCNTHFQFLIFVSEVNNGNYLYQHSKKNTFKIEDEDIKGFYLCNFWQPPKLV